MKETNKVVRFDYGKVKRNSLLKRYTFAKVCKEKKSSLYSFFPKYRPCKCVLKL